MFRNQLTALFTHERITTTLPKAKELRPLAERMVTLARTGTLANRRRVLQTLTDREVVRRLFEDIAPRFADRPGGYTRILRVGRRHGDNAELAIIEFVDYEPSFDDEGAGKGKASLMDRAKGMFGGTKDEDVVEPEAADEPADEADEADEAVEAEAEPELEAKAEPDETEEPTAELEARAAEPEDAAVETKAEEVEAEDAEAEAKAEPPSADAEAETEPEAEAAEPEEEEKKE
jgi:large subunit ribosomal protein L17